MFCSISYKAVLEYGAYCADLWTQTLKKARCNDILYNENMNMPKELGTNQGLY